MQASALIDDKTGAGNENMLLSELDAHLQEASARKGGVCLAMVRLNELEQITSDLGESVQDTILVSMYRRLRRTVRPTDVVTWLEDNTFGIIMHHSDLAIFKTSSLDRIMHAINMRPFKTRAGNRDISGSIGVHYYNGEQKVITVTEMVKLSRENLNRAIASDEEKIIM